MAHGHDHSHDENYFLDQVSTVAMCGLLAGIAFLAWNVGLLTKYNILTPQFNRPVLLGSLALVFLVAVRSVTLWKEAGKRAGHRHSHEHEHEHAHAGGHDHHHAPGEKCTTTTTTTITSTVTATTIMAMITTTTTSITITIMSTRTRDIPTATRAMVMTTGLPRGATRCCCCR